MDDAYIVQLRYGTQGLPYVEPMSNAKLSAERHGNTFTIRGNAQGLLFLAHNLIALAQMDSTPDTEGYHIHLDDLYNINDENIEFILRKDEQKG